MSATATNPPTQPAPRLLAPTGQSRLRPWSLLWRLRPVKVRALTGRLRQWRRAIVDLDLLKQHFPETLRAYDAIREPK